MRRRMPTSSGGRAGHGWQGRAQHLPTRGTAISEVKLFSAMLHREAVVIAQVRVPDETNETTQVAALLADVDLTGVVLTGDAAHAQRSTATHVTIERGGHYCLTVKD